MKSLSIAALVLVFAGIFGPVSAQITEPIQKIVDEVNACYQADKTKWDDCLVLYINKFRTHLVNGIPEMNIPRVEPTVVDIVNFPPDSALIQGKAVLDNLSIKGLSNYTIGSAVTDVPQQMVTIKIHYPSLNVDGHYELDGTMLLLPVKGDGGVTLDFTNANGIVHLNIERDGTGVRVSKVDIDFDAEKIVFRLENLLGGQEVGEAINNLINDNSQNLIKELKPALNAKLGEIVSNILSVPVKLLPAEPFIMP